MAREQIITAVEIGSSHARVGCALVSEGSAPQLIGVSAKASLGVRRGQVVDIPEASAALNDAFLEAERTAGVKISKAFIVVGGPHVELMHSTGSVAISRADGVVSEEDLRRVMEQAQAVSLPQNRVIIHARPLSYTVDSEEGIEDPVGTKGVRLEATVLLVLALVPALKALLKTVESTGRANEGWIYGPLATERAILSKKQTEAGVALVNIGGSTTTVSVFKEREPVSVSVIPMGGAHVTHDVAIGLRAGLDVAERVKLEHGHSYSSGVSKREQAVIADWGLEHINISRYAMAQIIESRMKQLFDLVERDLRKYLKEKALPAGIILTGGGSEIKGVVDLAKRQLNYPVHLGRAREVESNLAEAFSPSFSTICGSILWIRENTTQLESRESFKGQGALKAVKEWLRDLLP